jgi:hypothetical protein
MPKAAVKTANKTRAQRAKATNIKNTKKRAEKAQSVQAMFAAEKDSPVLADILAKAKHFIEYHNKIAQDGVAARKTGHKLVDGSDEIEIVDLTNDKRAGHLDKSAGIQELVDYIEAKLDPPKVVKKK